MTDNDLILCPHCGEETYVKCEYTETTCGTCDLIMNDNEPLTDATAVSYDGFHDIGCSDFTVTRYYCDDCEHDLTVDEIFTGRNNYLAAATKENK